MRTTREEEQRSHQVREGYSMTFVSPVDLPPGVYKDGFVFAYVNLAIRGQDTSNYENALRKGWQLVPASRCINKRVDPLGRNPFSKDWIVTTDLILMERPKHLSEEADRKFYEQCYSRIKGLRGVEVLPGTSALSRATFY